MAGASVETTIELNPRIRNASVTEFTFTPKRHMAGLKRQVQHYGKARSACMEKKYEHLSLEERALILAKPETNCTAAQFKDALGNAPGTARMLVVDPGQKVDF